MLEDCAADAAQTQLGVLRAELEARFDFSIDERDERDLLTWV
jgi:hypothetical protein